MTRELRHSENAQKKLNRSLQLISKCNIALMHAENEQALLNQICQLCINLGGYRMAWVGYTDENRPNFIKPVAVAGHESGYLRMMAYGSKEMKPSLTRGPTANAALQGNTIIHQDLNALVRSDLWPAAALERGYRASISLPLKDTPHHFGALTIYAPNPNTFTGEEIHLLEELANNLAFGIKILRTKIQHEASAEKIEFLANFDALTQLPNRLLLRDRFEQVLLAAKNERQQFALMSVDLDKFQEINDSFGHSTGDKVLLDCVERFRSQLAPTDTLSRLSADEFIILLPEGSNQERANAIGNAILESFTQAIDIQGQQLHISASIGISIYPDNGQDFETLLKCADTAVGHVKENGGNALRFYTHEMNVDLKEQMTLASGMIKALKNNEFLLHYQPQIHVKTGRITGAEALIRWHHPVNGMISPAKFIPLAERNGQIVQIGEWVLNEACRQARAWIDQFQLNEFLIAVNISALQFKRSNMVKVVAEALSRSNLPPNCLELELTESMLMQDIESTLITLHHLKHLGVKLSIDDFGTGYSSLSYLRQLTVDKLKVDQSFVHGMLQDNDSAAIVRAIVQLGQSLQLTTLAEGVETEKERDFLAQLGCDEIQGYFYSRPLAPDAFTEFYAKAAQTYSEPMTHEKRPPETFGIFTQS